MAEGQRFEFVVTDDPSAGSRLRAQLKQWLHLSGVNGATGYEIVSAVTEAFINAVQHPVGRASKQVAVEGEVNGGEVMFRVRDQGHWNQSDGATHGRYGFRLMDAQMDSVHVERDFLGTVVTLRRTI
jgi:anti-sigma regulatory factor (Ser/Thr protein kinase)